MPSFPSSLLHFTPKNYAKDDWRWLLQDGVQSVRAVANGTDIVTLKQFHRKVMSANPYNSMQFARPHPHQRQIRRLPRQQGKRRKILRRHARPRRIFDVAER